MKPYNVSGSIVPCPTLKLQFDGFLFSKKKSTKIKYLTCSLFFCILPIWWFVEGEKNHKCTQCAYWLPNDFQSRIHFALWSSLYCQTIKTILPDCTNTLIWNSLSWCDIIWSGVTSHELKQLCSLKKAPVCNNMSPPWSLQFGSALAPTSRYPPLCLLGKCDGSGARWRSLTG